MIVRVARAIIAGALCFAVGIALAMAWRIPSSITGIGYELTASGPLGPADIDMLDRVKQAGMWEIPVGEEAHKKAITPRLRDVGGFIQKEHHELNDLVDKAAAQLHVELPEQPTVEQRAWIAELSAMPKGMPYDKLAVQRLREAHGNVLPLLAQVYVSTRNDTIRALANGGMAFVNRHINYLESTGLVDHAHLPEAPQPKPLVSPVKEGYYALADRPTILLSWLVIGVCMIGAGYAIRSIMKGKRRIK